MGFERRQRPRGVRSAGSSALVTALFGTAVAVACGGESETLFHDPPGAGSGGTATTGGSGGKGATGGSGASAGTAGGGTGGSGGSGGDTMTGGSGGATGGSGGDATTGGTGGDSMGGTGGDGATGGTDGDSVGGTGGDAMTGGSGGDSMGGTGGAMGGSGGDAMAGSGGDSMGGSGGTGAASGAGGSGGDSMGGTGGGGGSSGKGGGTGGKGGKNCEELQAAARTALAEAQECSLLVALLQCTGTVQDLCGCHVPVNSANSEATKRYLAALEATKGCSIVCPAVECVEPEDATCVRTSAGSSAGRCRADGGLQPF